MTRELPPAATSFLSDRTVRFRWQNASTTHTCLARNIGEIVAYYRKLVAELHCKVKALRKAANVPVDLSEIV
jgi:hypothetical protein